MKMSEKERLAAELFERENLGRKWKWTFTEQASKYSGTPLPPATEDERDDYLRRVEGLLVAL